jgi:hypothetical protein
LAHHLSLSLHIYHVTLELLHPDFFVNFLFDYMLPIVFFFLGFHDFFFILFHKAEAINKSIHTYGILLSYYELFVNNHLSEYSVSLVGTALLNLFHCSFTLHSNSSRVSVTLHTEASSSQTCSQITRASSLIVLFQRSF